MTSCSESIIKTANDEPTEFTTTTILQVKTPKFSIESGITFETSIIVDLSCATKGATIKYSFDNVIWITGKIVVISSTTTLYAKASMDGMRDSEVVSATYISTAVATTMTTNQDVSTTLDMTVSTTTLGPTTTTNITTITSTTAAPITTTTIADETTTSTTDTYVSSTSTTFVSTSTTSSSTVTTTAPTTTGAPTTSTIEPITTSTIAPTTSFEPTTSTTTIIDETTTTTTTYVSTTIVALTTTTANVSTTTTTIEPTTTTTTTGAPTTTTIITTTTTSTTVASTSTTTYASTTTSSTSTTTTTIADAIPPADPSITINPTTPTSGNVTVAITFSGDSAVKQYKIGTGSYQSYSAPFTVSEDVIVYAKAQDSVGNWSNEVNYSITNIDKVAPTATVSYSTTALTNGDVKATITPSESVTITNNEGLTTRIFTANGSFTFEFIDAAGNTGSVTATVSNIDKTSPTATVSYSTTAPTNGDVIATITPSETVTITNNGGLTTYPFTANGSFTFNFIDAAGNTGSATATVANIDKTAPADPLISINPTTPTSGDVTVTITFSGDSAVKQYKNRNGLVSIIYRSVYGKRRYDYLR